MCHFPPRFKTDLAEAKIVKIGNPSVEYSPDMAPSDFHLSEKFKRHKFCFSVSVEHNLKTFFQQKTKCFYQNGANKLGERWKSYVFVRMSGTKVCNDLIFFSWRVLIKNITLLKAVCGGQNEVKVGNSRKRHYITESVGA